MDNKAINYLRTCKTIVVYGFSKNPEKLASSIPIFMKSQGYNVIGINPQKFEVEGIPVYNKLDEVPESIEILNVFRPSEHCIEVVKEAIERRKTRGDIKVIWLQKDIINDEAKKLAEANGIDFIQDTCIFNTYGLLKKMGNSMSQIKIKKLTDEEINEKGIWNWPIWEKEISTFDWYYDETEQCYFLEGKVIVKTSSGNYEIGKGDFVTFPAGLSCVWQVVEPVRKHYRFI